MKQITLFIIAAFIPVLTNADNGPFRPSELPLQSVVSESKPYVLEVAYALIPVVDEEASFDSIRVGSGVPSQQFFDSTQRLRISITDDDIGGISTETWPTFLYSVEKRDQNFLLSFYLRTELEGRQEIDTQVNLAESEWLLLGGLRREEEDSETFEHQVGLRIGPNGPKRPEVMRINAPSNSIAVVLFMFFSSCTPTAQVFEGIGKVRSPGGNWEVELRNSDPGLVISDRLVGGHPTEQELTGRANSRRGKSYIAMHDWTNYEDAFVYFDSEDRIWVWNGKESTVVYERHRDGTRRWSFSTWPGQVPLEVVERTPEKLHSGSDG